MAETTFTYVGKGGPNADAALDVVFVHGLTGDAKTTWTGAKGFWPTWLTKDHPGINVYSVGYDSAVWRDILRGNDASLRDRASTIAQFLATRKSKGRPIAFVTHSLGGLIVKKLLRLCNDSTNKALRAVATQARAVVFIATPHTGSNIATALNSILSLATNETTKELKKNSEDLLDLSTWFSGWSHESSITVQAFFETQKIKSIIVVDKVSANPNVVDCQPIAIDLDHIQISKCDKPDSLVYLSITQLVGELIDAQSSSENGGDGSDGDIEAEFQALCEVAPTDRRTLAEKLNAADRAHEIANAEARKESFNMALRRNITSPAAVARYTRLMATVKTRFDRHVGLAVSKTQTIEAVDDIIQTSVVDGTVQAQHSLGESVTAMQVEGAMYYLAGNCHIRWD